MSEMKVAKITISLPQTLVKLADRLAEERATSRSGAIAGLLKHEEEARTRAMMAEGYREMREENRTEAEEALNLTHEVTLRDD
jgi:metal-responsive CopG/Arc/MetJ family transcriptional regulator